MKKLMLTILVIVLLLPSLAVGKTQASFDYSVMESLVGYKYDKFEKSWSYSQEYVKHYSDTTIVIGLYLGYKENESLYPPMLYVDIQDMSGSHLYDVDTIKWLIGDKLYTYDLFSGAGLSMCPVGYIGEQMLDDIRTAKEISIKLTYDYKVFTFDMTGFENNLKVFADSMLGIDLFDYFISVDLIAFDLSCNATVE